MTQTSKQISITRFDPTLALPEYHTPGSVAFDFYARVTTVINAKSAAKIPTNLIIATPPGYALIIAARSSLFAKTGLILTNGIGIIDQDYAGPEDEIQISVYNTTEVPVTVERAFRLAQGMFVPISRAEWVEGAVQTKSRGGFGSTG